jgi:S1/P1 Nuclease
MQQRTFRISLVTVLVFLFGFNGSLPAYAWGPEGHEVVARIAAKHLTPKAQQAVKQLLGTQTLASVASFADTIRSSHPETGQWHFVDILLTDNDYDPARDCLETDDNEITTGDCVVEAVKHFSQVLGDTSQSKAKRAMALKFLVHFVGDMHQPLHCADNHDRGGNQVNVTFFGAASNLHKVWDSGIISKNGLKPIPFAAELDSGLSGSDITKIQQGDIEDWVVEAHKLAISNAYRGIPNSHALGKAYFNRNLPVVELQLKRGGLRLAKILNDTLK